LDPLERFNLSHWMGILSRMVSREMYEMRWYWSVWRQSLVFPSGVNNENLRIVRN
jgi:hypothetical protein